MIRGAGVAFAVIGAGAAMASPRLAPAPRCRIEIRNSDREFSRREMFNNATNVNVDIAGNVRLKCVNQEVYLNADSISSLSGDYIRLYGHVMYRDSMYRFTADTMVYVLRTEKLHAGGHVTVLDSATGSTLKGPYVDYYRQVKGVNDSARVDAFYRPTVRYFDKPTSKTAPRLSPYILTGERLRGFGQSRMSADSAVTLDHDSLHTTSDSIQLDRGKTTVAVLVGKPAIVRRVGSDSFLVVGHEIRFRLEDDKLRELRSFIDAKIVRSSTVVTGDTVMTAFTLEKLSLTLAWNRKTGATIVSEGYDVVGDSLAVETPGELLKEIRVFHRGRITNPPDTTIKTAPRFPGDTIKLDTTRNFLSGERVNARFGQVDSAGTIVTRLRALEAFGKSPVQAQSYYSRMVAAKDGRISPSINYTKADTILMRMKGGDSSGVAAVQAYGHVDGVQLETASAPTAKPDSTKPVPKKGGGP